MGMEKYIKMRQEAFIKRTLGAQCHVFKEQRGLFVDTFHEH